ncbi:MAG: MFS transporter [Methanomicrobiaceae archaeon]|nr:MFS transporter [Methanomicrobiaceae archaeon]MDD5419105.1 MFS transporter [Methanomicrobiaceae archaeon]
MVFRAKDFLTEEEIDRGLQSVIRDGIATSAMVTLTGGIFLVAFALQLGASNTVIGLLAAIPPLANLLQIPAIAVIERIRSRKLVVLAASSAGRLIWLAIVLIPFVFSPRVGLIVLIASIAAYASFSAVSHCSWNSWMRDLIPQERLGAFFARRMSFSTGMALALSVIAGYFIDYWGNTRPEESIYAYSILFFLGIVGGAAGIYFIARTPEPRMAVTDGGQKILDVIMQPFKDLEFRQLIAFLGSWSFAVNLAAPFFTVYMLQRLGLDMSAVILLGVLSQIMNIALFRTWGKLSDRFSNKSVLAVAGPLFMITIFAWTFTTLPDVYILTIPLLIAIHIVMGISLAGVSLASGNISLRLAPQGQATSYLGATTFVNSLAAGIAPILGGIFVDFFVERELIWTLVYRSPEQQLAFVTLDLQQWDFFFFIAFLIGLYSLHRLALVREEGEAKERIVVDELFAEVKREMRNFSPAGGLREMVKFPFSTLKDQKKR